MKKLRANRDSGFSPARDGFDDELELVSNIDRKVLYCYNDDAVIPDEEALDLAHEVTGKISKCCPHCAERLRRVREDRLPSPATTGVVLANQSRAYSDSVTRIFNSPWGRIKAHISSQSFFAPFVLKADKESREYFDPNDPKVPFKEEKWNASVPAVKRLIDEGFSDEVYFKTLEELSPEASLQEYSGFFANLRQIVHLIHTDSNPPLELDLTAAA